MFFVRFENRTFSTRSSSGNGAGIDVSLNKGTIFKVMLPNFNQVNTLDSIGSVSELFDTPLYFSWFSQSPSGVIHTLPFSFQAGDAQPVCNMQDRY